MEGTATLGMLYTGQQKNCCIFWWIQSLIATPSHTYSITHNVALRMKSRYQDQTVLFSSTIPSHHSTSSPLTSLYFSTLYLFSPHLLILPFYSLYLSSPHLLILPFSRLYLFSPHRLILPYSRLYLFSPHLLKLISLALVHELLLNFSAFCTYLS